MPAAEAPAPQSAEEAMWPPQAMTTVGEDAVKVSRTLVSDWDAVSEPCGATYTAAVKAPPMMVMYCSPEGRAWKLVRGCGNPATSMLLVGVGTAMKAGVSDEHVPKEGMPSQGSTASSMRS